MSLESLFEKKQEISSRLELIKRQLQLLIDEQLENALKELAFLNSTTILMGNYETKLLRQEKKIVQLRKALDGLVQQMGRLK